ncbi:MAG: hypothetical protein ACXADY_02770 [Candidatus Hodarchaeales archaeon]|jgi:hypothetical protein
MFKPLLPSSWRPEAEELFYSELFNQESNESITKNNVINFNNTLESKKSALTSIKQRIEMYEKLKNDLEEDLLS